MPLRRMRGRLPPGSEGREGRTLLEPTFAAALRAHQRLTSVEDARIGPRGRSLLLTHGERTERAYVLLHGLTSSPAQFLVLAHRLHAAGANVAVPRLPRHGERNRLATGIGGLSVSELKAFAVEGARLAVGLSGATTVAGFSAGGLLAAWLAQHAPLERVVAIAPFLGVAWLPSAASPALVRVALALPNRFVWWDPRVREHHYPPHGYPRYATHAVARTWQLAFELFAVARVRAPATREIVLVTNDGETTVDNGKVGQLAELWRAHGGNVALERLRDMPPSHDIVEPLRQPSAAIRAYPPLLALLAREHSPCRDATSA
ncbi:MAG: hypothetical protein ABI346_07225 [Candidatus Baltobacteraceae bacterium]